MSDDQTLATPAEPSPGGTVDPSTIIVLLSAITLATVGQLLLKSGMTEVGTIDISGAGIMTLLKGAVTTWQIIAGLAAFGASSVFWLVALSRVPLSTAYPVVSFSYLLILGFSVLVLDERPSLTVWSGAALIMVGISLIGIGQR